MNKRVRRANRWTVIDKNAGIPSSKGMCESKVPDKLKEGRDNRN